MRRPAGRPGYVTRPRGLVLGRGLTGPCLGRPAAPAMLGRPQRGPRLGLLAVRPDHHDHVPAVLLRLRLDEPELLHVFGELLEQPVAKLGPRLLPAAEHDRHLDLVALPQSCGSIFGRILISLMTVWAWFLRDSLALSADSYLNLP